LTDAGPREAIAAQTAKATSGLSDIRRDAEVPNEEGAETRLRTDQIAFQFPEKLKHNSRPVDHGSPVVHPSFDCAEHLYLFDAFSTSRVARQ
jgi:hypothetical protein